jgi:anaerobic selenocysteine-containing dehydrogenase
LKAGAKLIVVDPRRIDLVDFAELWLPLKPGTNVPVFTAMAQVIVEENLVNHDFVNDRTEGYTEFLASLEKFTPEFAEEVSGVPAEDIRRAARLYARAKNAAIYWGMGISQLSHGTASALRLSTWLSSPGMWARWHGTESAARAEQRAGRQRHGRHAIPLPRLHAS